MFTLIKDVFRTLSNIYMLYIWQNPKYASNSFMPEVPIIQKPVHCFAEQMVNQRCLTITMDLHAITALVKIWSFPITISSVNVAKSAVSWRFDHIFFSSWVFLHEHSLFIHRTAGKWGRYLVNSSLPLPPASQALRHERGDYCRGLTSTHG